jgi:regulation of enolase protein 1 (concanavalin A-like superfamily)
VGSSALVKVSWSASSGATSYNVKRSTTSGGPYTTIASPTGTSYNDTAVSNGTTYYYVVSAAKTGVESANSTQVSAMPGVIPSPWNGVTIGSVGLTGSGNQTNGVWTLRGAGLGVQGTADSLYYVYQSASGDCSILARVTGVQLVTTNSQSGVMIRNSENTNVALMSVSLTASNQVVCAWRTGNNKAATSTQVSNVTAPVWVQVNRTASTFTGSYSTNGTTWITITSQSISMGGGVDIGMAVSSGTTNSTTAVTIDNVTATP